MRARRVVPAGVEDAEAVTEEVSAAPLGRLRIGAPVGFGASRPAPLVTAFLARYPHVEVELVLTGRFVDLVGEGFDAVLRLDPIPGTSLAAC